MKKKKGFTLVELLVVIAILAVLATVSVVGYMGFTKKAQISNDESLVTQLNTALKADEVVDGKPETPTKMLSVMEDNGFKVENLTPTTSKYNIVWNQEDNQFALLDEIDSLVYGTISEKAYMNWRFVDSYVNAKGFSCYIKDNAKVSKLDITTGLDVGNNTSITTINYKNESDAQNVVIRTYGETNLTIDAKNDVVNHYGIANRVDIKHVASESYHEYDTAKAIIVESGHVVVENESIVKALIVNPSTNSNVSVNIKNENVTVYKTENATNDNSNVYGNDNNEQYVTTTISTSDVDNTVTGANFFDGGIGTEDNPYLIATGEQAYDIEKGKNKQFFKIIEDVIVTNEIYISSKECTVDLNGHSVELKYADNVKPNNGGVFNVAGKKSKLVIKDTSEKQTGKVIGDDKAYANKVTSAIRVGNYGKLDVYGGEFIGRSEGTSCIFTMTSRSSGSKATVNIYGGKFRTISPHNGTYYVLNHQDSMTTGCTMNVKGGTFVNYNPGVTIVDPINAYTGKVVLDSACTTTSKKVGNDIYYTVSK